MPLPDPVRAAAEHDDLPAVGGLGLAFGVVEALVGRVQIGGAGRELGRAGVDALVDRPHALLDAAFTDLVFGRLHQVREATIGEAATLQLIQRLAIDVRQLRVIELQLDVDELLDLHQEPRVDARELMDLLHAHAHRERVADVPDALRPGLTELELDLLAVLRHLVHAVDADLESPQRLLERLLERATDRHHFADRLHLRGQVESAIGNFSNAKRGTFVTT